MKLYHASGLLRRQALFAFAALVLIGVSACGEASAPTSGSVAVEPTATTLPCTSSTAVSGAPPAFAFNCPASAVVGGLQVATTGIACDGYLVLKGLRPVYDAGTLQAMAHYVEPLALSPAPSAVDPWTGGRRDYTNGPDYPALVTDPGSPDTPTVPTALQSVLAWVPGAPNCFGRLELTNVSSTSVAIRGIEVTLAADTEPNAFSYQLIDVCTLARCNAPGGASPPCAYFAPIQLHGGRAGARVDVPLSQLLTGTGDASLCPLPLLLKPTEAQEIIVEFTSNPQHLVYAVNLALQLGGSGSATLAFPSQFEQHLVFVDKTVPFSCYGLQRNRFVLETPQTVGRCV